MEVEIQGVVGPQVLSDGVNGTIRQTRSGSQVVQEIHGRYFEQAFRKNIFTCYSVARALSLVGTAMIGLQVWNGSPISGGVNLILLKTGGYISVTSATTTGIILATGTGQVSAPTSQTAADAVKNNFIGGPSPQATGMALGTFTNAPTGIITLEHNTAAIATTGEDSGYLVDLEGSIVVPPQAYVCVAALGAAAAASAWNGYLMWEEVPV